MHAPKSSITKNANLVLHDLLSNLMSFAVKSGKLKVR